MSKVKQFLGKVGARAAAETTIVLANKDEKARLKEEKARKRAIKAAREVEMAPRSDGSIWLNLGCGDKIFPGWTNVDIVSERKEMMPDVQCDLRDLTFEDNYADVAMAVHVIEHFYLWEVPAVLAEWKRVLKPGGRLILECPNLLEAAKLLVENPDLAFAGGKGWSTTMFPLYGDPAWEDPLMCHRWGWISASLILELEKAGFVDVRQEPALYKKSDPRDMRIVGQKPV